LDRILRWQISGQARLTTKARRKVIIAEKPATAPRLAIWMEENLPQGFAAFAFPREQQLCLRTTNPIEGVNKQFKRRTNVASLFPNEASGCASSVPFWPKPVMNGKRENSLQHGHQKTHPQFAMLKDFT
jgi:transposase-like protein